MIKNVIHFLHKRQKQQPIFSSLPGLRLEDLNGGEKEELSFREELKNREAMSRAGRCTGTDARSAHQSGSVVEPVEKEGNVKPDFGQTGTRQGVPGGAGSVAGSGPGNADKEALKVGRPMQGVAEEAEEDVPHEEIKGQKEPSCNVEIHSLDVNRAPLRHVLSADPFASVEFVHIHPGVFHMGSSEEEPRRCSDEAVHQVTLTKGFFLQTAPVTNRQWKMVMGANPPSFSIETMDCPVHGVNWQDCQELIKKLSSTGGHRYRLPREAEWEYACRAGTLTAFSHGDACLTDGGLLAGLDAIAWYSENSEAKPHPVGRKARNAWGLYDMHGNVCEWCEDWYGEYGSAPQKDPVGALAGSQRVCRGGCWGSAAENCRSACRFSWSPDCRSDFVGFRLVREEP